MPYTHQTKNPNNQPTGKGSKKGWLLFAILILILVVAGLFFLNQPPSDGITEDNNDLPLRTIGPDTAPVTITEYADFACITCKAWHQFGIREEVLEVYGEQVRFVWRDFPVTAPSSPRAAEAGFCAHEQGQFWAYHDITFANAPALRLENLKAYAEEIDLDMARFSDCLDTGRYQSAVEAERSAAINLGLRSVPSFTVNERRLIGPPSFDQLASIIDEILVSVE